MNSIDIPEEKAAEVARKAHCDTRSVVRYLLGWKLRPLTAARIELALVELGMPDRVRRATAS